MVDILWVIALNGLHNRGNPFLQLHASLCALSAAELNVLLCSSPGGQVFGCCGSAHGGILSGFGLGGFERTHRDLGSSALSCQSAVRSHCVVYSSPYLHELTPRFFSPPSPSQGKPVEILPFLYLGSAYHASRQDYLSDLHITALLNVSRRDLHPAKGHYDYKWIPVEDSHMADISSHFQEAIEFIGELKGIYLLL